MIAYFHDIICWFSKKKKKNMTRVRFNSMIMIVIRFIEFRISLRMSSYLLLLVLLKRSQHKRIDP